MENVHPNMPLRRPQNSRRKAASLRPSEARSDAQEVAEQNQSESDGGDGCTNNFVWDESPNFVFFRGKRRPPSSSTLPNCAFCAEFGLDAHHESESAACPLAEIERESSKARRPEETARKEPICALCAGFGLAGDHLGGTVPSITCDSQCSSSGLRLHVHAVLLFQSWTARGSADQRSNFQLLCQ
eukprot:scaffold550_cov238-Pinguiococcus_pyrenoidosus.AAC.1